MSKENKFQIKYFINKKPLISSAVNNMANLLKYLSIKTCMGLPYFQIRTLTKKNLAERLSVEAIMNMIKLTSNAPAETVKTLNGIGVKPAVKIIQKFHVSYFVLIK